MYSMKINDVVKYVQYATKHVRVGPKFVVYAVMAGFADSVEP